MLFGSCNTRRQIVRFKEGHAGDRYKPPATGFSPVCNNNNKNLKVVSIVFNPSPREQHQFI